jgi:hypothetical protein
MYGTCGSGRWTASSIPRKKWREEAARMGQFVYDQLNSFGTLDLSGAGAAFPDTLDLDGADISRMTADIKIAGALPAVSGAPAAAALTVTVEGSDAPAFGSFEVVGRRDIPLDALAAGKGSVAVSPNGCRYIRVRIAKTFTGGTSPAFSAGVVEAFVNSYLGK